MNKTTNKTISKLDILLGAEKILNLRDYNNNKNKMKFSCEPSFYNKKLCKLINSKQQTTLYWKIYFLELMLEAEKKKIKIFKVDLWDFDFEMPVYLDVETNKLLNVPLIAKRLDQLNQENKLITLDLSAFGLIVFVAILSVFLDLVLNFKILQVVYKENFLENWSICPH